MDLAYVPWSKVKDTLPQGIQVPICFYSSLCKLMELKVIGDDFGMKFIVCENYEYDPPKCHGKDRPKLIHHTLRFLARMDLVLTSYLTWTKIPLPLCEFMQWLDIEQSLRNGRSSSIRH